jgi:phage baseplate assembly protein W
MTSPYRALLFANPDALSTGVLRGEERPVETAGAGLTVTATGSLGLVEGDAAVRQAILLLLSTIPGERVMRPRYGSELHRLVFAPNDQTTAGLAIHYVRQALQRWEPRVEVTHLDAGPHPDWPDQLVISLEYRVRATRTTDALNLAVDLGGGQ